MRARHGTRHSPPMLTHTRAALARIPHSWWRSPVVGYLLGPVSVGLMTLARLFVDEPLVVWVPFCVVAILEAVFWGVGPALLTMTLALLAISYLVMPEYDLLTLDIWNDVRLLGPFVLVQTVITWLAAQRSVQFQRTREAKEALQRVVLELTNMNYQLEQAQRREGQFFTRAAHELRTPLTAILGEAQLALRRLRKTELSASEAMWRAHFEHIEQRADGLRARVEDLIELYYLRGEEHQLRSERCNVSVLCAEYIEQQRRLSDRQIELELPSEPVLLHTDCERLRSAIANIVDNALIYAPASTPIQVRVLADARNVSISVHNEDTALSNEQQERLFDPFYRTQVAEARYPQGWGLGLTISKAFIERYGGRIWVESAEQDGITFFVELPISGDPV